jgi:hypothetical protein
MNPLQRWRKEKPRHVEESAPAPQAEPEAPTSEATLPEASIVEGKYSAEVGMPVE